MGVLIGTIPTKGERMGIKVGRGKAMVELEGDLGRQIEGCIRQFAPTLLDVLDAETKSILDAGRGDWPIGRERTGKEAGRPHSKDEFDQFVRIVSSDRVEGFIENRAPYVFQIKTSQNGVDGSPWVKLIRKPVEDAADRLGETMAEELAALVTEGGR